MCSVGQSINNEDAQGSVHYWVYKSSFSWREGGAVITTRFDWVLWLTPSEGSLQPSKIYLLSQYGVGPSGGSSPTQVALGGLTAMVPHK